MVVGFDNRLHNICRLIVPMDPAQELFPVAGRYPQFFNTNLVDPNRIIKVVEGRHCSVRAFYYQLLKLIFQIECAKDEQIDYLGLLGGHMQQMLAKCSGSDPCEYLRDQVHNVNVFMKGVQQTGELHFEPHLNRNKEADVGLVAVLSQILKQHNLENASVEEKIGYLCQIFELQVAHIDKCIKIQESDVFIYIENQKLLYIAFLALDETDHLVENSIDRGIEQNRLDYDDRNQKKVRNNDTIINIFGDMLHSSKHDGESKFSNSFLTNNLNSSLSPAKKDEEVVTSLKTKHKPPFQSARTHELSDSSKTNEDNRLLKNESNVERYSGVNKERGRDRYQQAEESPDALYRPKSKLPTISEVTSSKQSLIYSHKYKKDPLDLVEDEEKGTFYRQFTNTRILNILPEPQRTNVKMLRNRFIGLHTRDFKRQ